MGRRKVSRFTILRQLALYMFAVLDDAEEKQAPDSSLICPVPTYCRRRGKSAPPSLIPNNLIVFTPRKCDSSRLSRELQTDVFCSQLEGRVGT